MRILTLGSDRPHPLTQAALAVVDELEWVEHVDHLTANDERTFLRNVRSPEYRMHVASLKPDLMISAAYARIVPDDVLATPTLGAINIHPSLLPDYRGVCAVWWALYEGCPRVGVTIHQMTVPVDTGPILGQTAVEVGPDPDPVGVWRELGDLSRPLLIQTLEQIRDTGRISGRPQPEGGSYRGSPYTKEARRLEIDWSQPAEELVRRNRILRGNIPAGRRRRLCQANRSGGADRPAARHGPAATPEVNPRRSRGPDFGGSSRSWIPPRAGSSSRSDQPAGSGRSERADSPIPG